MSTMVDWQDEAIILSCKAHGEKNALIEAMTPQRGRHFGLVRSGLSASQSPTLQAGNSVRLTWRARLEEQLGIFTVEPVRVRTGTLIEVPNALHVLNTCITLTRLLPERDPHIIVFDALHELLNALCTQAFCKSALIRFEMLILQELGFGLDLSSCAATGSVDNLVYVSPKSARAVSAGAGEPYQAKLLALPPFLHPDHALAPHALLTSQTDLKAGFALTGYFLNRHVFGPRGMSVPEGRSRLIANLDER
jgi:DNA repair protein RecO (recombination protein O)